MTHHRHARPGDPPAGAGPVPDRAPRGVRVADAARDFGVTERQLRSDLELLWVCGLPGYGPGDLIDLSFDGDHVRVTFTAGMGRPLRLTTDEAVALVVALRTLLELPGLAEREAVSRALAKVSAAAGHAAAGPPVAVSVDAREEALAVVRRAWSASGPCTCTTTWPPGTSAPSAPSTRCGCCSSTASGTWRPGAAAPRGCGCSGSTGSTTSRARRAGRPAAAGPRARRRQRRLPARARRPRGPPAAVPQRPLGRRLLPGRLGDAARRRRPRRRASAPPTWPGPGGSWPRSAGTRASRSRPTWPPRSPPTPGPRSPGTGSTRSRRPAPPVRVAPWCC